MSTRVPAPRRSRQRWCESCRRRPATRRLALPGAVPFAVCNECLPDPRNGAGW
jgi:hypothetical protein